jgi:arylsulfatase A-like enzyme
MRRILGPCVAAIAAILPGAATSAIAEGKSPQPSVIFILADDLGYGELGCFGQTKIRTPNIDRMAAEGMRFTNFYCGSTVCAPSRCALMTGKHLGHATVRDNMARGPGLEGNHPMQPGTITVAQLLKQAGYATAIIGKWGLGMPEDHSSPLDFGFDHHYGYLCQRMAHSYYPPYLWRDNRQEPLEGNPPYDHLYGHPGRIQPSGKTYAHDLFVADALDWVRRHKSGPFFLYLAFTIPHISLQVPADSLAEYRGKWPETPLTNSKHYANCEAPRATYAAMITRMDRDIGRLMAELKQLGLDDQTLVFFASDNGACFADAGTDPDFFQSNGILRGHKQDLYEGGIRTPLVARWPGRIKTGVTSSLIGAFWDVLPTFCELAGVPPPAGTDGLSIVPTLLGRAGQKLHEYLYWEYHSGGRDQAVRFGDWKAVRNNVKKSPDSMPELYDLARDPSEKSNVAAEHPEVAAKAAAYMKAAHSPCWEPKWNF